MRLWRILASTLLRSMLDEVGGKAVGGAFETGGVWEGAVVLASGDVVSGAGGVGGTAGVVGTFEPDEGGGAVRLDGLELVAEREETSKP